MKTYPEIIQGSDEWYAIRLGMVTASCFGQAMAKGQGITRNKYMNKLVYERMYKRPAPATFTKTKAMQHGNDTEDEARDYCAELMGFEIKQVGFVEYNEDIGCSPDGLIGPDDLAELKCPETSTHMDYIRSDGKKLIATNNKQAQGQMFLTGRNQC